MQGPAATQCIAAQALVGRLRSVFEQQFNGCADVYRAPGRVNLIGEHTDYNDGFVMPAAIGFYTFVAAGPREDQKLCVYSEDFSERREFDLSSVQPGPTAHWSDYVRGVAGALLARGHKLRGANLAIKGEVPIGAGLSSSASIEVACALALLGTAALQVDRMEVALACQQAEHQYAGAMCGIMDQFISCFGQAGHALMLDCRTLEHESLDLDGNARIVICNTKVKHTLAGGEYNLRRQDCEDGVQWLKPHIPGIRALRDVTMAQLEEFGKGLPGVTYRRCRHVIGENDRVRAAAQALKSGDMTRFGSLMGESHASLRDDYEVSCKELDSMVKIASGLDGVYGSRMTGGGFGGCTVNLVREDCVEQFKNVVGCEYEKATGITPEIYVCDAAEGAGSVPEEL